MLVHLNNPNKQISWLRKSMFKTSIKQTFKDADLLVSHKLMIRIKIADPW